MALSKKRKVSKKFRLSRIQFLLVIIAFGLCVKYCLPIIRSSTNVLGEHTQGSDGGQNSRSGGEDSQNRPPVSGGREPQQLSIEQNSGPNVQIHPSRGGEFGNSQVQPSVTQGAGEHGNSARGIPSQIIQHGGDSTESGEINGEDVEIASNGGELHMPGKHLGVLSHFPISINSDTNELTITTPAGTKTVAVLPDQAVQNMLTHGILSKIDGLNASGSAIIGSDSGSSGSAAIQDESGSVISQNGNVQLTSENGSPVYKINGSKEKRFLGLIPVNINKTVTVSAEDGQVQSTNSSIFGNILNFFSL